MFKNVQKYSINLLKRRKNRFSTVGIALDAGIRVNQNNPYKIYTLILGIIVMLVVLITLWLNADVFFPELSAHLQGISPREFLKDSVEAFIKNARIFKIQ